MNRPAIGANNPLRSLGATYARQAQARIRVETAKWLAKYALNDDLELRPGVFRHAASESKRPDYYLCQDCRQPDPTTFMVEDDVWESAGLILGIICVPCFEVRLGRKLTIQDFKAVPMNDSIFLGYLLSERLS